MRPPIWDTAAEWSRDDPDQGFGLATKSLTVTYSPVPSDGFVRVVNRSGTELLAESVDEGSYVQEVWLDEQYLLVQTINTDERTVAVEAFNVADGAVTPIDLTNVNATGPNPPLAAYGRQLAWTSGFPDDGMCLRMTNLATGRSRTLECAKKGVILDDLALDNESLVFSSLTQHQSEARRCKQIKVIDYRGRHDAKAEHTINSLSECLAWSAVPLAEGIAWDVADPSSADLAFGHGYALDNGTTFDLGEVYTDSFVSCGGTLFWTDPVREATTPFLWEPGKQHFEVGLELVARRDESATALHCASDRFLTTRVDELSGHDEHLRLLVFDTHAD